MLNSYFFFSSVGLGSGSAVAKITIKMQKQKPMITDSVCGFETARAGRGESRFGIGELAIMALSGLNGHFNGPSTKAITI